MVIGNDEDFYEAIAISTNVHIAIQTPIIAGGSSVRRVILWDFALGEWTVLVTDEDRAITDCCRVSATAGSAGLGRVRAVYRWRGGGGRYRGQFVF